MRELGRLPRNVEDMGEGVVIDVRDLRMRYGSVDVLRGVEFIARRGEVLALLGLARAERGWQDDHHRDSGGVQDALGRGGRGAWCGPGEG